MLNLLRISGICSHRQTISTYITTDYFTCYVCCMLPETSRSGAIRSFELSSAGLLDRLKMQPIVLYFKLVYRLNFTIDRNRWDTKFNIGVIPYAHNISCSASCLFMCNSECADPCNRCTFGCNLLYKTDSEKC